MISQKALGLIFLLVTSAAWIGASFITQALVSRDEEEPAALEPWLLTLICSSTLMIYLPIGHCARKRARYEGRAGTRAGRSSHRPRTRQRKGPTVGTSDDVAFEHASGCLHPRRRAAAAAAASGTTTVDSTAAEADDATEDDGTEAADAEVGAAGRGARAARGPEDRTGSGRNSRVVSERQPLLHAHTHTHNHAHGHGHKHPHGHPQHSGGNAGGGDGGGGGGCAALAGGDSDGGEGGGGGGVGPGGDGGDVETSQIVRAAFVVAPVWFAAQLAFTASLEYTSVTSNTVLSSCSSLFVYLGSLALGQEVSSALRFVSVLGAMAGTTLVALGDRQHEDGSGEEEGGTGGGSNPLFGDALTLVAAALYALYTIMMKRLLVKDDAIVMALFFGTIGVLYFAVLAPVVGALALAGSPVVRRVTTGALGLALVQGLIDYVAADYAWARAVMLLGPTATSCGLAMQIPAAGVIDAVINGSHLSWSESPARMVQFIVGSLLIIVGFVGVSLEPRVVSALWKRCTNCVGATCGGAAASAGGGGGGSSAAAGGPLAAEAGVVVVDGLGECITTGVAAWEAAPRRSGGGGGMDSAAGAPVGAGSSEERVGLLMGGEGEPRRGNRRGSGGGGWAAGGGGAAAAAAGASAVVVSSGSGVGGKARGYLRQMGLGGGGGGGAGGGGGGGGGASDVSMYIPLSSTAGGGVHVVSGRGVLSAAVPDT